MGARLERLAVWCPTRERDAQGAVSVEQSKLVCQFGRRAQQSEPGDRGPARPSPEGDQSNVNQSSGGTNTTQLESNVPLSEKAHSSTDELGTIALPKEKPRPYKPNMPAKKRKIEAEFEDGLTAKTTDDYFTLTFHNLTQVDYRNFAPTGNVLVDNFLIPRQRWYVLGNVSPYVRYYTVINRGYNSIDLLDAFIDLNMGVVDKEKFQVRMGRMKTPYTYEYIKVSENDLIAPERSVFVGNLAPNREIGAMAHGQLLDKRFEYAVGLFNGPRRSFIDTNNSKDVFTFINTKPFLKTNTEALKQLNLGGSFNFGYEDNVTQPQAFRTASDQSTGTSANQVSPTFLQFGNNILEDGLRMQWSGDMVWYYRSFAMMAAYQGGFQNYGVSPAAIPSPFTTSIPVDRIVKVPYRGFNVTAFYFITGEEITRRANLLEPRSEFKGLGGSGTGAVEVYSRFANLTLGDDVFSGGLANPGLYTNRINVLDNGANWYLNHYTKLTFDWQYSMYGNPVYLAPGKYTTHQNIFWLRASVLLTAR